MSVTLRRNNMESSVHHYEWCYVSGRVNVLECSLLSTNFFEKLLSSDDFKDILTNLSITPLKAYFSHVKHLYKFETLLDDYYYSRLYEIRLLSPDSAVCDFFLIKNDFLNLKKVIKSKVLGTNADKFLRGTINKDTWDGVWQGKAISLPEIFKELISFITKVITHHNPNRTPTYPTIQKGEFNNSPFGEGGQGGVDIPSQEEDKGGGVQKESLPFIIDLIFDGAYLKYLDDVYDKMEIEIIKRYLKICQLVKGIAVIRRAMALRLDMNLLNQYFLEGFDQEHLLRKLITDATWISGKPLRDILAETHCNASLQALASDKKNSFKSPQPPFNKGGSRGIKAFLDDSLMQILSSNLSQKISFRYEVATDDYLLDMLRPVKCIPFGPERVFGYLCGLTTEVFNLKLVLGGKVHRIENNLLKERLRKTYV